MKIQIFYVQHSDTGGQNKIVFKSNKLSLHIHKYGHVHFKNISCNKQTHIYIFGLLSMKNRTKLERSD